MTGEDLVRIVPVLTARETAPVVAFYGRLGFEVAADHGDYLILATHPIDEAAVEVHLSRWDEHDPRRTAGTVYLRVSDAAALHERLRSQLQAESLLYLAPATGLTPALTREGRSMEDPGTAFVRLHEISTKP